MTPRFPASFLTRASAAEELRKPLGGLAVAPLSPPTSVRRPIGYEPNYAYPLLVWFHDAGEDERSIRRVLPAVSDRNYVGLALRGERRQAGGYDWRIGPSAAATRAGRLAEFVRELRGDCNIHTERIVLAGSGAGANAAAQTFFSRPEWFGGFAAFGVTAAALPAIADPDAATAEKPALIGSPSDADRKELLSRLGRAGLSVTARQEAVATQESLRHLNRWLLAAVCGVL